MNVYLKGIEQSEEIIKKISSLGDQFTDDVNCAQTIIYKNDLPSLFLGDMTFADTQYIISLQEFLEREKPYELQAVHSLDQFKASFANESITDVTSRIEEAVNHVFDKNSFNELQRYLKLISIELVQNALIHGKKQGISKPVEFEIIRGRDNYLINVKDYYGEFDKNTFINSLIRAYRDKTYENKEFGAGLGLSMILSPLIN